MWLVLGAFADESFKLIVNPARFACVAGRRLEGDRSGTVRGNLEEEGICIWSKFLD